MRRFTRAVAYRALRWWREMIGDLVQLESNVQQTSEKIHRIAGRAHVLEMEAYGETKPRKTLPPPPTNPTCHH